MADFLLTRPDAGAVGPSLVLPDGRLDPDARRAFPVPSTLFYRTVGLSRLFPKSPRFGRHNMGHLPESDVHEMDAGSAACLMVRMAALERVGFFDPRYFMFGEDVDLCYRLKLGGWKIFYLPAAGATHHVKPATAAAERQMSYERHRVDVGLSLQAPRRGRVGFRQRPRMGADLGPLGGGARSEATVKRPKRQSG